MTWRWLDCLSHSHLMWDKAQIISGGIFSHSIQNQDIPMLMQCYRFCWKHSSNLPTMPTSHWSSRYIHDCNDMWFSRSNDNHHLIVSQMTNSYYYRNHTYFEMTFCVRVSDANSWARSMKAWLGGDWIALQADIWCEMRPKSSVEAFSAIPSKIRIFPC